MEFDVAEDFLGDFVADLAVERDKHGFGKRQGHEFLYYRVVVADNQLAQNLCKEKGTSYDDMVKQIKSNFGM